MNIQNVSVYVTLNGHFIKKNAFVLTKEYIDEPRRVSVTNTDSWYIIKLSQSNEDLLMNIYNKHLLLEKFKVISIENVIVLVRLKKRE